jgi:quercetin dioxygenase-like cupin family protein
MSNPSSKKASEQGPSCRERDGRRRSTPGKDERNAFYQYKGDFRWRGVRDEPYKPAKGGWSGIVRRVLIGSHGESAKFHVRYFEIAPGGRSGLEKHRHEHVVICVRGKGVVRTGKTKRKVGFMDTVYISPDTTPQLMNTSNNPFGFFCIVNAKRDRPKVLG